MQDHHEVAGFPSPILYVMSDAFLEADLRPNLDLNSKDFPASLFFRKKGDFPAEEEIRQYNPLAIVTAQKPEKAYSGIEILFVRPDDPQQALRAAVELFNREYHGRISQYRQGLEQKLDAGKFIPNKIIWKDVLQTNEHVLFFYSPDRETYHIALDSVPLCYPGTRIKQKKAIEEPGLEPCETCRPAAEYLQNHIFDNMDISRAYMIEWLGKAGFNVRRKDWDEARRQVIAVEQARMKLEPKEARSYGLRHFPAYDALMLE